MSTTSIRSRVERLSPWFHNLNLQGVDTAPDHFLGDFPADKFVQFRHLVPEDLSGLSVLDIGANAGFYAIEMKRRGARRVVALEPDPRYRAQAELAFEVLDLDISLLPYSVYDVGELQERFDLVLFMGVFYHLRHPLLALDLIHEHVAGGDLLFQSLQRGPDHPGALAPDYPFSEEAVFTTPGYPALYFVEDRYAGDPTNWFVPNPAGTRAMLRTSGFSPIRSQGDVHYCRKEARPEFVPTPPHIARRG